MEAGGHLRHAGRSAYHMQLQEVGIGGERENITFYSDRLERGGGASGCVLGRVCGCAWGDGIYFVFLASSWHDPNVLSPPALFIPKMSLHQTQPARSSNTAV